MTHNHSEFDDDLIAALSETNLYEADPRPEHLEELRAKLLARTVDHPAEPATLPSSRRPLLRRVLQIGLPVAAAILIAVVLIPFGSDGSQALADVLQKTIGQTWIHGRTTWVQGGETVESESWISPAQQMAAFRHPAMVVHIDHTRDVSAEFLPGEDTVYLVRPRPLDYQQPERQGSALEAMLSKPEDRNLFTEFDVSELQKAETTVDGKPAVEYTFRLAQPANSRNNRRVRAVVDGATGLLTSWEEEYDAGLRVATKLDYPDDGPSDIYALGVPDTVTVVDRLAATDVTKIASQLKEGRIRFDDYDAIIVQHVEGQEVSLTGRASPEIRRVRRTGAVYRVDQLLRARPEVQEPAAGTDLNAWWRENRENYWSAPMLICDGRTVATYSLFESSLPLEGEPNLAVELRMENPVSGLADDPTVSCEHLMPEFNVRPHLWTTDKRRTFVVEPSPDDGPEGTVQLVVNDPGNELMPERARYWLDPDHEFCLRKSVEPVFDRKKQSIAYINTEMNEGFEKSPQGHWYATRTRRMTTAMDVVQVRDYYVDFDVELNSSALLTVESRE